MTNKNNKKYFEWVENWQPAKIRGLDTPCWNCISHAKTKEGYTRSCMNGIRQMTHSIIYETLFGYIPHNFIVRHRCDNPLCINPEHLESGTKADNAKDRDERGRHVRLLGEQHGRSKLNTKQVLQILNNKNKSGKYLAHKFNVSETNISRIRKRKIWKHVII